MTLTRKARSFRSLAFAALALAAVPAHAQVQMVVNFTVGGPSDLVARLMQPDLSAALGQSVVVRNTTGAAGTIGAVEVARAKPDGQTLLFTPVGRSGL